MFSWLCVSLSKYNWLLTFHYFSKPGNISLVIFSSNIIPENLLYLWFWKANWTHFIKKFIWYSNPKPGDIPKGMQHRLLRRHLNTTVHCSTIHNSQVIETTKMPNYWWMDQENVVFVHNGILLSHEEEWNLIICR
jgi:hypothetical protein